MLEKGRQDTLEIQNLGPVIHEREHDDAERILELGMLVQLVQDDGRKLAFLEFDHHADAVPVRFIPNVGNAFHAFLLHQLGNFLQQLGLVHLVRNFGHDDARPVPLFIRFHVRPGADGQQPSPVFIGVFDALRAIDESGRGKIRTRDHAHQVRNRRPGILKKVDQGGENFAEIMRGDVGGVAHGDPPGAVDQQVGDLGRQHQGFDVRFIIRGAEIHRFPVDVRQHFAGQPCEPCFGVAHGGRRVTVHRPVIPLAIHQGIAHVEVLGHAHLRIVNRGIAVGMIIPHDFAHDLGRLAVGPVVRQPHLVHAVQDAPVHGFQPVTDVRQGAADDHAHGVIHVRQAHLVFDGDLSETFFGGHRGWEDRSS